MDATPILVDEGTIKIVGGIIVAIAGGIGTVVTLCVRSSIRYLRDAAKKQRDHETAIMDRVDKVTLRFDTSVHAIAARQADETRQTIQTMMNIQSKTIEAMSQLGTKVGKLGTAVDELRAELRAEMQRRPDPGSRSS